MTAALTNRGSSEKAVSSIDLPVKASTKIVGGTITCTDASGWGVPATATTALRPWGRSSKEADNTSGSNGDVVVNVKFPAQIKVQLWENDTGSPVTAAMRGQRVYMLDNQTLTADSSNKSPGPYVYEVTSEGVWAWFETAAGAIDDVTAGEVTLADAGGLYAAANVEALALEIAVKAASRTVRGVVTANVSNLAAFTVAGNDGLTYTAGQRVLLANQTTAAQCGVYVVGTVNAGTAPLTRVADMPTGAVYVNGSIVEVSEGTVWRGSSWKVMGAGALVVGTDDPLYYPRSWQKTVTLASGTYLAGAGGGSEPVFLYSTTTSSVQATRNTAGGTLTNTTHYFCPVASRIAGKAGTAAVAVTASVAAGTVNAADESTVDLLVTNW